MPDVVPVEIARLLAGKMDPPTHLFIDETGDRRAGYDGDFYLLTCIATEDPDELRSQVKKAKVDIGLSTPESKEKKELKSRKLSPNQRETVLSRIATVDCHVLPYAIHKPSLTTLHFETGGSDAYRAHLAN